MGAQCSAVASKEGCRDVLRRPNEVWRLGSGAGAREEEKTRVAWGLCTRLARLPLAVGTCAGPAASAASGARARGVADGSRRALLLADTWRGRRRRDGHFRAATGTWGGIFFFACGASPHLLTLAWVRGPKSWTPPFSLELANNPRLALLGPDGSIRACRRVTALRRDSPSSAQGGGLKVGICHTCHGTRTLSSSPSWSQALPCALH